LARSALFSPCPFLLDDMVIFVLVQNFKELEYLLLGLVSAVPAILIPIFIVGKVTSFFICTSIENIGTNTHFYLPARCLVLSMLPK
jgi:hypothetical protein